MSALETKDDPVEASELNLPDQIVINELRQMTHLELRALQKGIGISSSANMTKAHLVFDIATFFSKNGVEIICHGLLEGAGEKFSMLRDPARSFRTSPDDCYMAPQFVKQNGLRNGHHVRVKLRAPKGRDKFLTVDEIIETSS